MQMLAKCLIRPFREEYTNADLGPPDFILQGKVYSRIDVSLQNSRGLLLQCSWFKPKFGLKSRRPCIVYCHGNCGSRRDSLDIAKTMLLHQLTVFTMDFSGSGVSEGEFVSLGYYESWDLKTAVEYLRNSGETAEILLWGRSMGAASVILYASCDPHIALLVLDSPFLSLKKVIEGLVWEAPLFRAVLSYLICKVRKHVMRLAKFDILDVDPSKYVKSCQAPAVFLHGLQDKLVAVEHTRALFEMYPADKFLLELGGGHNSGRPESVLEKVYGIIAEVLRTPSVPDEEALNTSRTQPPSLNCNK